MSENKFIYYSTMSKRYNDYQYRQMIKSLNIRQEPEEIQDLDNKLLDLLEQSKILFCRYGTYKICTFRKHDQVGYISFNIEYKPYFSSRWSKVLSLEYMPKVTPPAKSIYPSYDVWINVSHLLEEKHAYIGNKKYLITPFKDIYYHNNNYNIKLVNNVLFNASIDVDDNNKFTLSISLRFKKHGKMHSVSGIQYSFVELMDTLMHRPIEFAYRIYFPNNEVDIDTFELNPKKAFKLLEMIDI